MPLETLRSWHDGFTDLDEIANILAAGLIRHFARMSTPKSPDIGESSLDIFAEQSGPVPPSNGARQDG